MIHGGGGNHDGTRRRTTHERGVITAAADYAIFACANLCRVIGAAE